MICRRYLLSTLALALVGLDACDSPEEEAFAKEAAGAALAKIARKPNWAALSDIESRPRMYQFAIGYRSRPSMQDVAADTTLVVRAMITELMARGRSPSKNTTIIMCGAGILEVGETGTQRIHWLGWTTYQPIEDSLEFKPER